MKRLLKIILRTVFCCLILTAGVLAWMILVGIPTPLVESVVNSKMGAPLHFSCTGTRVSPLRGLIARDVRLELKRDGADVSLEAAEMTGISTAICRRFISAGRMFLTRNSMRISPCQAIPWISKNSPCREA